MVIFGAGASYDSDPTRPSANYVLPTPHRPPLANQLFDNRPEFARDLSAFPECIPIVPLLRHTSAIEQQLERLRNEATEDPPYRQRLRQLAAVRGYLQLVLSGCDERWLEEVRGITNYSTLLDEMLRWGHQRAVLVTFNYDRLLERAITLGDPRRQFVDLGDYLSDDAFSVIKVHGSANWGRVVKNEAAPSQPWDGVHRLIASADSLEITNEYVVSQDRPIANDGRGRALVPAIAIPVESKQTFECPDEHLKHLTELLPQVGTVLIVGWRGMDNHFVEILKQHMGPKVHGEVVCGNQGWAEEVVNRLTAAGVPARLKPRDVGFTEYVVRRLGAELFRLR